MTKQRIPRRLILIGVSAGVVAAACGDDETSGAGGNGGASASSTSSGNTGGANAGGASAGGASAGGANAGGANAGGANAGGMGAGMCGATLVVKGSNYAKDPHDITIPLADIEAGVEKQYTSTMANNHTHTITITAADFAALQQGDTVKKYVCFEKPNFTDHEWVISCADPSIMPTFEGEIGTPGNCPA